MATTHAQKQSYSPAVWLRVGYLHRNRCSSAWLHTPTVFRTTWRPGQLKLHLCQTPANGWEIKSHNSSSFSFIVYEHALFFFFIMDWYHTFKSFPPSPTLSVFAVEKNPCQTNPCLHGGSCLQEGDGYSCYCPQGFSGESCEIGESLPGQPCAGKPRRLAAVGCLVTVS